MNENDDDWEDVEEAIDDTWEQVQDIGNNTEVFSKEESIIFYEGIMSNCAAAIRGIKETM